MEVAHSKKPNQAPEPKPAIRLKASGFCVAVADKVVLHIEWASVREVVAFKEDLFAYDEICVGFRTDDSDCYSRVTEEFVCYAELIQELPQVSGDSHQLV